MTEQAATATAPNARPASAGRPVAVAPPPPSLASLVKRGVHTLPLRVLLYGPEKIGKTTFAAGAPNGIVIGPEDGTGLLDQARIDAKTWPATMAALHQLLVEKHEFTTVIVDTVDHIEPLMYAFLKDQYHVNEIEEAGGGYGKWSGVVLSEWTKMLVALDKLREKGMAVILLAHAKVGKHKNPDGQDFDRYFLSLYDKAAGLIRQWCDVVLFTNYETFVSVDKQTKRAKGVGGTERVVYATRSATYDAGNRINLPDSFPLSWADFAQYAYPSKEDAAAKDAALRLEIADALARLGDAALTAKVDPVVAATKSGDINRLSEVLNRLSKRIVAKEST